MSGALPGGVPVLTLLHRASFSGHPDEQPLVKACSVSLGAVASGPDAFRPCSMAAGPGACSPGTAALLATHSSSHRVWINPGSLPQACPLGLSPPHLLAPLSCCRSGGGAAGLSRSTVGGAAGSQASCLGPPDPHRQSGGGSLPWCLSRGSGRRRACVLARRARVSLGGARGGLAALTRRSAAPSGRSGGRAERSGLQRSPSRPSRGPRPQAQPGSMDRSSLLQLIHEQVRGRRGESPAAAGREGPRETRGGPGPLPKPPPCTTLP